MSLAAGIRVSVLMLLLLLPASSITQQLGILPVRVAASGASKAFDCSGLVCAWAFGFPGSWDLDLLLPCHTQVLACVEKGASCNSNDADDGQVILTAASRTLGRGGCTAKTRASPGPMDPIRHPSFSKAKGKRYAPRGGCDFEPTPQSVLACPRPLEQACGPQPGVDM